MAFGVNGNLWQNQTIPYEIDASDFPLDSDDRRDVLKAISEWNRNTVIRLIPRTDESDYVIFEDTGTSCSSQVGRVGGDQSITCDLEGGFGAGNLMHEIGHAVGLYHEHSRPDRDSFVRVGVTTGINCREESGSLLTDYDCGSIMHYGVGSSCNISLVSGGCRRIGQRDALSGHDVWGVSIRYGIPMQSVVVWQDDSDNNSFYQIHKAGFSELGRRCSGPITVNTVADNQQRKPEAGMAANRDMVFVWEDDTDGNGYYQIKMRGFTRFGRESFSQRTVNVHAAGQQKRPHISTCHDGRFNVVWEDDTDENGYYQIKMRGFTADGNERFAQRTVNAEPEGQQYRPRVAMAPDGSCVVVWQTDRNNDGSFDVRMRGFNADGTVRWSDRRVNPESRGNQRNPRVAMAPSGDFVVVWEDDTDGNGYYQIHMRGFDGKGNQEFGRTTVNVKSAGQQLHPDVAVDSEFRPVVVWSDDRDENGYYQIKMRGFENDASERISERTVNTTAKGQQRYPSICMEADGKFVVAYEDDRNNDGKANILIRGYNADGTQAFSPKHVSNRKGGRKVRPSLVAPAIQPYGHGIQIDRQIRTINV